MRSPPADLKNLTDQGNAISPLDSAFVQPVFENVPIPLSKIDVDAIKVIRRLNRHGYKAYLVGGGVRDLLLDRNPKDFDIATSARPPEVRRLFRNCRLIGRRFRLAHILFTEGKIIEVATFRRDPNGGVPLHDNHFKDGFQSPLEPESAVFASTVDDPTNQDLLIRRDNTYGGPHEDAIRRDFTINSLFYDIKRQQVIDYVGGLADLRIGVVRTIGRPDLRFREDPVRIIRAIKFSARLDLGIIPEVYDAMVSQRWELRRAAPPRMLEEILRLLRGGAAHRSIYLAWDIGVLGVLFPDLSAFLDDRGNGADQLWGRLAAIDQMYKQDKLPSDAVLLTALLYDAMQEAVEGMSDPSRALQEFFADIVERFALPRKTKERMQRIFASQSKLKENKRHAVMQREYYQDAVKLFELQCRSQKRRLPKWFTDESKKSDPRRKYRPRKLRKVRN